MIHLTAESEVMLALKPVDFRRGIDSLSGLCQYELKQNPRSGVLFVFISKDKTKVRVLVYEDNGFWLMTKRLSAGTFTWPENAEQISQASAGQLRKILSLR
jgi:transposase